MKLLSFLMNEWVDIILHKVNPDTKNLSARWFAICSDRVIDPETYLKL
ncbi:MAG: hypothetical protein IPH84_11825, partial [Bacteroidales bacterium]|nr:hypothetical protein [Bacteroidales bacterium]